MPRLFSLTYGALPYWCRALSHSGSGNRSGDAPSTSPNVQKKYYPSNKNAPIRSFFFSVEGSQPVRRCVITASTLVAPCNVPSRVRHPNLAALSAYPRAYGTRSLSPYLHTLARTVPMLATLSAYPRAYGTRSLSPYLRTLARTVRTLPPLAAYLCTSFYASYCPSLHTFLIIYLYLLYKSFKGFI